MRSILSFAAPPALAAALLFVLGCTTNVGVGHDNTGGGGGTTGTGECNDQCSPGEKRCSENSVETCIAAASGCMDWGAPVACGAGATCTGGQCAGPDVALAISAGSQHACALLNGGRVKCWGFNGNGRLGLGDTNGRGDEPNEMGDNLPPVDLGTGKTAVAISAGQSHTCAILNDGSVKCWGGNGFSGQLGLGDTNDRGDEPNEMGDNLPPVDLGAGKTAVAISAAMFHTCAMLNDGSVKCWGNGKNGRLGQGDTNDRGDEPNEMGDNLPPVDLGTGKTAVAIRAGLFHTCAVLNDGSAKCWGANAAGALGLGDTNDRGDEPNEMGDNLPPVDLGTGKTAAGIQIGNGFTCALLNAGSVKCWGGGAGGVLGLGDPEWQFRGDQPNEMGDNLPPVDLGTGKTATAISAGDLNSCAVLNDGSVKCWGGNNAGQLGQGDKNHRGDEPNEMGDNLPPVDLGAGKTAVAVSVGQYYSCALLSDGSIKCWGWNDEGELGLGNTSDHGAKPNEMGDNLPPISL